MAVPADGPLPAAPGAAMGREGVQPPPAASVGSPRGGGAAGLGPPPPPHLPSGRAPAVSGNQRCLHQFQLLFVSQPAWPPAGRSPRPGEADSLPAGAARGGPWLWGDGRLAQGGCGVATALLPPLPRGLGVDFPPVAISRGGASPGCSR